MSDLPISISHIDHPFRFRIISCHSGRGLIENEHSTDIELTKTRNRAVCEGEGKCPHDGLGVGRSASTNQTQFARLYEHSH